MFRRGRFVGKKGEWPVPLHKPSSNGKGSSGGVVPTGSEGFLKDYPTLVAFLCSKSWPDGSLRERGTLLISTAGSQWQLKVRDPNGQRYAFYVESSLQDALTGLDMGLDQDDLDWRPEKPFPGQRK